MNGITNVSGGGMTVTFTKVTHRVTRKVTCPVCGKKRTISRTDFATVNPFNCNADGSQKTMTQVRAGLVEKMEAWEPRPVDRHHKKCWESNDH